MYNCNYIQKYNPVWTNVVGFAHTIYNATSGKWWDGTNHCMHLLVCICILAIQFLILHTYNAPNTILWYDIYRVYFRWKLHFSAIGNNFKFQIIWFKLSRKENRLPIVTSYDTVSQEFVEQYFFYCTEEIEEKDHNNLYQRLA